MLLTFINFQIVNGNILGDEVPKKELFTLDDELGENDIVLDDFGDLEELETQSVASEQSEKNDDQDPDALQLNLEAETEAADVSFLDQRIRSWVMMLKNFKSAAQSNLDRKSCINGLLDDICKRYSYNRFLALKLFDLFPKEVRTLHSFPSFESS